MIKRILTGAAGLAMAGAALTVATPANAAGANAPTSATTSAKPSGARASSAGAGPVITCTFTSDYPHRSHTKGSTKQINFHPVVKCSQPVASISISATMHRSTGASGTTKSFRNAGKSWLKGNAQIRCTSAKRGYYGTATATVIFPPRYVPSSGTASIKSATKYLNCKS